MPGLVLVDSNVLLDILEEDKVWYGWSAETLAAVAEHSALAINPVIFAEVSIGFSRIEEVDEALPPNVFQRHSLPWEAAFLAGKSFLSYRRVGGSRRSPLPDFFIGAHALIAGMALLTRDAARYQTYFPKVRLITPEKN